MNKQVSNDSAPDPSEAGILRTIDENDSQENYATDDHGNLPSETSTPSGEEDSQTTEVIPRESSSPSSGRGSERTGETGSGTPTKARPGSDDSTSETARSAVTTGRPISADAQGNLVDANGSVVIKAGAERRLWERAGRLERQVQQEQATVQDLTNQLAQHNAVDGQVRALGLAPQEAQIGLQLAAQFKRDPVSVAKTILQQVTAMGHNIEGAQAPGGVDAAAIRQMVQEAVAPLTQQQQQQQQLTEAQTKAQQQVTEFFNRFPNATVHEDLIESMLRADSNLSLDSAYLQLENFALRNGLDITKPLRQQIEAGSARQGNGQQQGRQPEALPNGQSSLPDTAQSQNRDTFADPSTSYKDIVRQSMLEQGMRIS